MSWPFFPTPIFAWGYYLALVALTGMAAYNDLRTLTVPKWLTVGGLGLGLLVNIIRGAWLGMLDQQVWVLPAGSAWIGGLDGFLFGLAGFLVAFTTLFILWILGACGGGDVKLFGAVGGWVGIRAVLIAFPVSLLTLLVFLLVWFTWKGLSPRSIQKTLHAKARPGKMRMTYSLPIAVATAAVLLWGMRGSLLLVPPSDSPPEKVQAHVQ